MSMKSFFLSLFVLLALQLVGCGRSKPPSSRTATAETAAETEATPPPPDALPPKPAAAPAAVPPPPAQPISFTALPAGQDQPADAERQKLSEIRAKQAQALEREKAQRAAEKQNQPESERDQ